MVIFKQAVLLALDHYHVAPSQFPSDFNYNMISLYSGVTAAVYYRTSLLSVPAPVHCILLLNNYNLYNKSILHDIKLSSPCQEQKLILNIDIVNHIIDSSY